MYLYENSDNKITIYMFSINERKVYDYKKDKMQQIAEDNRVLRALTNDLKLLQRDNVEAFKLNYRLDSDYSLKLIYHRVLGYSLSLEERERQQKLLEEYYKSLGSHNVCHVIPDKDGDDLYFLLLSDYHLKDCNGNYVMDNIINIPKSLYYLEKFLTNPFDLEDDADIAECLSLYDYNGKRVITKAYLEEACKYNIVNFTGIEKKSDKVLELALKKKIIKY